MAPRLVELCFQTAGLWEAGRAGPARAARSMSTRCACSPTRRPLPAACTPSCIRDDERYDCAVVDELGTVLVRVEGYRTIALPGRLADDVRAPVADAMAD